MTTRSGASWRQEVDSDRDSEFDDDERQLSDESEDSDDEHHSLFHARNDEFIFVNEDDDVRPTVCPIFYGTPGMNPNKEMPTNLVTDEEKIRHFIDVIFTDDFFATIAQWTNKRAEMHFSDCFDELSTREKRWHDTNSDEMKKFFGLI